MRGMWCKRTLQYQIENIRIRGPYEDSVVADRHSVFTGSACPNSVVERKGSKVLVIVTVQLE